MSARRTREKYLGMRPGDLNGKPYAPFWKPDMAPMPEEVLDALARGEEASELALSLGDADKLLEPGYLSLENGYARLPNGQRYVAVRTEFPNSTGAMFEWWMGWHYMEDQRYKLWHPRAHIANGTLEMRGDDAQASNREKYMTTHYVTEYIGARRGDICISFCDPRVLFGANADLCRGGTSAVVCGRVARQKVPISFGWLVHQLRETSYGCEMRSRFWLGRAMVTGSREQDPRNWLLRTRLFERLTMPATLGRDMLTHCAMEMNHLASFLPELYALYHGDKHSKAT